jgi:3-oxoadipate enol-lactonase
MTMHLVRAFGANLHVEDEGTGPAILCLHSLAGSLRMWDGVATGLRQRMRVVRFDARGHGRSTGNGSFSVERNADDALAVVDALGLSSCVVMGISMGGQTAIRAALQRPGMARGLIIANSSAGGNPMAAELLTRATNRVREIGYERFAAEYVASRMARANAPGYESYLNDALRLDAEGYLGAYRSILSQDLGPLLHGVHAPTLVIGSSHDISTPLAATQRLCDGINQARHHVIEAAGHFSCMDQPGKFLREVENFVNVLPAAASQSAAAGV